MKSLHNVKVLVFPKDKNPYQGLLYAPILNLVTLKNLYESPPTKISKIFIMPILMLKLSYYRIKGYKIVHIHWLYPFSLPSWIPFSLHISFLYSLIFLSMLRLLKYKVVWTVHNILPHDKITINDLYIRKLLANIAESKFIHSSDTIVQMNLEGINSDNTELITHGNYIDIYTDKITISEARKQLDIDKDTFVILFLGAVRNDKGIEELLDNFITIQDKNACLMIVGKCRDKELAQKILAASKLAKIHFVNKYVSENEVVKYIKACDIFCVPYTRNTTSGSAILSMSLQRSVIAPRLGSLKDMPLNTGYYYDPKDPSGLSKSIRSALGDRRQVGTKSKDAYKYISSCTWSPPATKTYELYKKIEINRH